MGNNKKKKNENKRQMLLSRSRTPTRLAPLKAAPNSSSKLKRTRSAMDGTSMNHLDGTTKRGSMPPKTAGHVLDNRKKLQPLGKSKTKASKRSLKSEDEEQRRGASTKQPQQEDKLLMPSMVRSNTMGSSISSLSTPNSTGDVENKKKTKKRKKKKTATKMIMDPQQLLKTKQKSSSSYTLDDVGGDEDVGSEILPDSLFSVEQVQEKGRQIRKELESVGEFPSELPRSEPLKDVQEADEDSAQGPAVDEQAYAPKQLKTNERKPLDQFQMEKSREMRMLTFERIKQRKAKLAEEKKRAEERVMERIHLEEQKQQFKQAMLTKGRDFIKTQVAQRQQELERFMEQEREAEEYIERELQARADRKQKRLDSLRKWRAQRDELERTKLDNVQIQDTYPAPNGDEDPLFKVDILKKFIGCTQ